MRQCVKLCRTWQEDWCSRNIALLKLSFAPSTIPEDVLFCNEKFVILIYDRTSTSNDIDNTRIKLFKNSNVIMISPTRAAQVQHVKRATYQGVMFGVIYCYQARIFHHQLLGNGPELVTTRMNHTGRLYQRQLTSVNNWCSTTAERMYDVMQLQKVSTSMHIIVYVRESVGILNTLQHYL